MLENICKSAVDYIFISSGKPSKEFSSLFSICFCFSCCYCSSIRIFKIHIQVSTLFLTFFCFGTSPFFISKELIGTTTIGWRSPLADILQPQDIKKLCSLLVVVSADATKIDTGLYFNKEKLLFKCFVLFKPIVGMYMLCFCLFVNSMHSCGWMTMTICVSWSVKLYCEQNNVIVMKYFPQIWRIWNSSCCLVFCRSFLGHFIPIN